MTPEQEKRCEGSIPEFNAWLSPTPAFRLGFRTGYAAAIEREVPRWRPIETAPKDGTHESPVPVLLWADGLEATVRGVLIGERAVSGEARGYDFTHWQPLPEPPKEG